MDKNIVIELPEKIYALSDNFTSKINFLKENYRYCINKSLQQYA